MKKGSIARSVQSFFEKQQKGIEQQRKAKIQKLKALVKVFAKKYSSVESLFIVGSLVKPDFYRSNSDVDIVVKGLPVEEELKAGAWWEKMMGCDLDLILWEDVKDTKTIKEGVKIYEKKGPNRF